MGGRAVLWPRVQGRAAVAAGPLGPQETLHLCPSRSNVYFVFLKLFGWCLFFVGFFFLPKYKEQAAGGALGLLLLCGSWWGRAVGAARPTAQLAAGQPLPESPAPSPRLLPAPSRTWERVCAVGGVAVRETWRSSWIPTSPYSLPSLWGSEVLGLRDPGVRGRPWLVEGRGVCALGL